MICVANPLIGPEDGVARDSSAMPPVFGPIAAALAFEALQRRAEGRVSGFFGQSTGGVMAAVVVVAIANQRQRSGALSARSKTQVSRQCSHPHQGRMGAR